MDVRVMHRMEENMKNKMKVLIATCIGCMLLLGGAITVLAAGTLSIAVSSGTVAAGETMTITVYAVDANNVDVTADMNITYDSSKLEYVSSSAGTGGGGTVKATGSTVTVKFKAIGSGDAYVKAEGATLTAAGTHINVSKTAADSTKSEDKTEETTVVKSGDNSLSSLKISSGTLSPAFKGNTTQYTATVGSDVNEITVTPVTSNSKATIESVTGNTNLKTGENVIAIVVKAENGTEATYKITVTKTDTVSTTTDTATTTDEIKNDNETSETSDTADTPGNGNAIVIDGVTYAISEDFEDSDIPEGFSKADFEYKGTPYKGLSFDYGHLGLYYLVNEAGEGKFFVYDADRDGFYPYIRMTSGEHFIILMVVPNGAIPPEKYEETTLTLPDSTVVQAYQYAGPTDMEIVNFDNNQSVEGTETSINDGARSDFYIFYGMDDSGVSGWYQYDVTQGTYQRLNGEIMSTSSDDEKYESLLQSYNELDDRYKATKTKDRRFIVVLIFVSVVLVIIIINMFLKYKDMGDDDEDDDTWEEKKPIRKEKTPVRKTEQKSIKEEIVERERVPKREPKKEDTLHFYEDDDMDTIDEFEDDPGILTRKPKKREKVQRPQRTESVNREPETPSREQEKDDDIEFLDLNDL